MEEERVRPSGNDVRRPEVRFARSGNVRIAFGVVGDGPFDIGFVGG